MSTKINVRMKFFPLLKIQNSVMVCLLKSRVGNEKIYFGHSPHRRYKYVIGYLEIVHIETNLETQNTQVSSTGLNTNSKLWPVSRTNSQNYGG